MLHRRAITALVVWASVQAAQLYGQIPVKDLVATIGPWECVDSNGVHGMFISGVTDEQAAGLQSVSIFVYQRGVQGQSGYFIPSFTEKVTEFDGKRLKIAFKGLSNADFRSLPAFDLNLGFDPAARRWTGAWSLCDKPGGAVLERPLPSPGTPLHDFVGKWEGAREGMDLSLTAGTLQIYQSVDGRMSAGLHLVAGSRHHVYEASLEFPTARSIVARTTIGHKYEGTLSDDGKSLNGTWINDGAMGVSSDGRGPTLNAPRLFRRTE